MTADRTFVIVGAGQAGAWTARTLRDEGFDGRLVLIGDEAFPPYERPPLSKAMLLGEADANSAYFWPAETYDELKIELRLGTRVAAIRPGDHVVEMAGGETLSYHRLMLATGSRPREMPIAGADLAGIHTRRVIPDTLAIRDGVPTGGTARIVCGGWIGMEVAAAVTTLGAKAVIVEAADRLCARALTPDMSAWLLDFHTAHGIDVRLGPAVARFERSWLRISRKTS